jgi:hypothetical protein
MGLSFIKPCLAVRYKKRSRRNEARIIPSRTRVLRDQNPSAEGRHPADPGQRKSSIPRLRPVPRDRLGLKTAWGAAPRGQMGFLPRGTEKYSQLYFFHIGVLINHIRGDPLFEAPGNPRRPSTSPRRRQVRG